MFYLLLTKLATVFRFGEGMGKFNYGSEKQMREVKETSCVMSFQCFFTSVSPSGNLGLF